MNRQIAPLPVQICGKGEGDPNPLPVKPSIRKRDVLTSREIECLEWAAAGKTSNETAELLSLAESTINFHIKNGIIKLEARNRAHAVAKAITRSLIKATWSTP